MPKSHLKISVIGAGFVGATLAQRIFESGLADVVLVDVLKGVAAGKAMDLLDAAPVTGTERSIIGTDDYAKTEGSEIVVVTAGLARKPGMTREDLVARNAAIIKDVSSNIRKYSPSSILIIVTNPLDTMTYLAYKNTGFHKTKVFGMAGVLDSSRLITLIADELKVPRASVSTHVLGSHGDTMVPLISHTLVSGKPLADIMANEAIGRIIKRTRERGAEIVSLLGTGSAFYSPSASVMKMLRAIIEDTGEIQVVSAYLEGEYGLKDICIGVPCALGRSGIKKVVEVVMSRDERSEFDKSAVAIKSSIQML